MAEIEVTDDRLLLHVPGIDRVLALTIRLEVPLAHVVGAEPDLEEACRWWHGVRERGVDIPHVLTAGRVLQHGDLGFWDLREGDGAVSVRLGHEQFSRLVVDVPHPEAAVARINAAVSDLESG